MEVRSLLNRSYPFGGSIQRGIQAIPPSTVILLGICFSGGELYGIQKRGTDAGTRSPIDFLVRDDLGNFDGEYESFRGSSAAIVYGASRGTAVERRVHLYGMEVFRVKGRGSRLIAFLSGRTRRSNLRL